MPVNQTEIGDVEQWNEFWENMRTSEFRREFLDNPRDAIERIGAQGLPPELLAALTELSIAELRLLADLANRFVIPPGPTPCVM